MYSVVKKCVRTVLLLLGDGGLGRLRDRRAQVDRRLWLLVRVVGEHANRRLRHVGERRRGGLVRAGQLVLAVLVAVVHVAGVEAIAALVHRGRDRRRDAALVAVQHRRARRAAAAAHRAARHCHRCRKSHISTCLSKTFNTITFSYARYRKYDI